MNNSYLFHYQVVLRTPAQPFTLAIDAQTTEAALANKQFMEAIYLASPALCAEFGKWQRGELVEPHRIAQLRSTLTRYYVRFMSRCTPFGLFAGCSMLKWGPTTSIQVRPTQHSRRTRLDMHYLCALAQQIAARSDVQPALRYQPNTSIYRLGREIRYIERSYEPDGSCTHQITALEASEALEKVLTLAAPGRSLAELSSALVEEEAENDDVHQFLTSLLAAQVLVSELEPTVTGDEFFQHLLAVLRRLANETGTPAVATLVTTLTAVQQSLAHLDASGFNDDAAYAGISALLAPLGVPIESGKLFQTDAHHSIVNNSGADAATLDAALQEALQEALTVLSYLTHPTENARLLDFVRRFRERYEEQEVGLLEALDTESGISYTGYGKSRYSSLVEDLALPEVPRVTRSAPLTPAQQWLRQRLQEAERTRTYSLAITTNTLRAAGLSPEVSPLPPSMGVLFRLIGGEQLLLESAGGSSAVNLLGRFAHAIPAVELLIKELTTYEQTQNPGVRFAEISHLPANRIGNLLQRPHLRTFEIPYLAQSTRPATQQLLVQNLTLAVREGQLVLREKHTGQRIVPRLSTAHNFEGDMLPVYQLLCDLQTQGLQGQLGVNWTVIAPDARFTPRLTCGTVVLAAATWRLNAPDWQALLVVPPMERLAALAAFRTTWQLPRLFTLADGDNELLVDAENELLVGTWLNAIRLRTAIVLKEFLFDAANSPVRDVTGRPYVAQGLALLLRQTPCYVENVIPSARPTGDVPRDFTLGSEWLYYKLYCGQLMADRVLLEVIRPLVADLQARGLVDRWFFVRYADPDNHLRVRWHLPTPTKVGEVVRLVSEYLSSVSSSTGVWKVQTDTYRRELERYGHRSISAAEALFSYQSHVLLEYMSQAEDTGTLSEFWLWGLGAIDELLNAFDYSLARKVILLARLRAAFAQEFNMTKALKQQLDAKYRSYRSAIQQALLASNRPLPIALQAAVQPVRELIAVDRLEVPLDDLLASYVHMLLNRLLPADARLHELVLYDFLHRHYQSCQARYLKSENDQA